MKKGIETGKLDDNGRMIKCGDTVEYFQWKQPYRQASSEDGWGRDIALCRHDQIDIPAREKTLKGKVVYSIVFTGFRVEFDDYMLESGKKDESLYCLGKAVNSENDRLVILDM